MATLEKIFKEKQFRIEPRISLMRKSFALMKEIGATDSDAKSLSAYLLARYDNGSLSDWYPVTNYCLGIQAARGKMPWKPTKRELELDIKKLKIRLGKMYKDWGWKRHKVLAKKAYERWDKNSQ